MLARVADSLYWTGRYIERSEHLARYLKVQHFAMLDSPSGQDKASFSRSILNFYGLPGDQYAEDREVLFAVGLEEQNGVSIHATVKAARENARSVRHLISTELWEAINQYYLFVKNFDRSHYEKRGLHDFTVQSINHCAVVRSHLDYTLLYDDAWMFVKLGLYVERAAQILRILIGKSYELVTSSREKHSVELVAHQLNTTLQTLQGLDMHRRVYLDPPNLQTTFEFLIANTLFPRSIACTLKKLKNMVEQLEARIDHLFLMGQSVRGLIERIEDLEFRNIEQQLPWFLEDLLQAIYALHDQFNRLCFTTSKLEQDLA